MKGTKQECEVSNSIGEAIVVLDVASVRNESASGIAYEENLCLLNTSAGSKVIEAEETQTVLLQDRNLNGEESTFYELLLAEASSFFPATRQGKHRERDAQSRSPR